jgi:hypothetical protein
MHHRRRAGRLDERGLSAPPGDVEAQLGIFPQQFHDFLLFRTGRFAA